jgi:NADH:ubiquinone oxidoreductase subunit 5 (subunit L)/multisubunit Na+/H+ antiporter MnhA subunit
LLPARYYIPEAKWQSVFIGRSAKAKLGATSQKVNLGPGRRPSDLAGLYFLNSGSRYHAHIAKERKEGTMNRELALKIVLVVVGLLFTAGVIPLTIFFSREPAVPMIMSIYVTLGIFLLLAVRNPAANRTLIAFSGWANLAHAAVMAAQEYLHVIERRELTGVVVFAVVGIVLVALAPARQSSERVSAVVAR